MHKIIQSAISAIDRIPSGNASVETHLAYQRGTLYPVVELLRELDGYLPALEELEFVKAIIEDFVYSGRRQMKLMETLERISGEQSITLTPRGTLLEDDVKIAEILLKKIQKIIDKETIENVCSPSLS